MKTFLFLKKKGKAINGFTLIELLVVIAIIGVLASIVLASLNNARKKSRDARRITDIKQIQLALELYFDGTGANNYPAANANCVSGDENGLEVLKTPGNYIPQIPRDPLSTALTNGCYRYASPTGGGTQYHLGTNLEDAANTALGGDADLPIAASGWTNDFTGLAIAVAGTPAMACTGIAGTPGPNGTEVCYDQRP